MQKLAFLVLASFLAGCATSDRANVRSQVLITGQEQEVFLKEWGPPSRTYTEAVDLVREKFNVPSGNQSEQVNAPSGENALAIPGKKSRVYNIWEYPNRGATLVFYRDELVTWKWAEKR